MIDHEPTMVTPKKVDLATGGTPAMDNNHASYPASNAFDSDIATFALANPSPPTALYYDFGSGASIVIDAVAWTARNDAFGPAEQPITGKIVAKQNSGDAWTELADPGTQSAWAQGERRVWAI